MSLQDRDAIERGKRAMKWISADPHNRSEEATRDLLHGFRALLAQPEAQAEEGEPRDELREALAEVDETLTELGWHTDRGILMRVRSALAAHEGKEKS